MQFTTETLIYLAITGVAVLLLLLIFLVLRRKAAEPGARLKQCCSDALRQVYLPDGEGGQVHIEYALLCPRGIVVVDLKEVKGNVFGSDLMHEWAVITGKARYGFANPQDGLFDRIAAIKRLLPESVAVEGYIAFTEDAAFTKGVPGHVVMFDELVDELRSEYSSDHAELQTLKPAWETLREAAVAV